MKNMKCSVLIICVLLAISDATGKIRNNKLKEEQESFKLQPSSRINRVLQKVRNIKKDVNGAPLVCSKCEVVVGDIIKFRKSGANRESVREYIQMLCGILMEYKASVCEIMSDIETDVITYIIDNKDVRPQEVCGIYLQYKGCMNPHAKEWTIDIPPKQKNPVKNDRASDSPLKIVQITDVHYDPLYSQGSNAQCDMPLCCEERNAIPNDPKDAAGKYADYRVCDMSKLSVSNLMTEIRRTQKDFDFVYFTGDIVAHKNWETSRESNLATIEEFYGFFSQYMGNVTVYPILGNHEAHPCNLYAPLNKSLPENIGTLWLFEAVADYWSSWLPKSALETIKLGGYYTVLVRNGFRIIGLNSNVCFTENIWLAFDDEDPYGQLKWLVKVLLEAEKNNEKVHILSHVPPGEAMCHRQWQYNFNRIVQRFSETISAHFNGHTHVDEFRIYTNESNSEQVINVAYNGGSFTTFVGLNPDYRLYEVDAEDLMVQDYHQYTFNLSLANSGVPGGPQWYKLYSFKTAYGLNDLGYDSLLKLTHDLSSVPELSQQYIEYHIRKSEFAFKDGCNETCVQSQICHISAIDADKSIECGAYTLFN